MQVRRQRTRVAAGLMSEARLRKLDKIGFARDGKCSWRCIRSSCVINLLIYLSVNRVWTAMGRQLLTSGRLLEDLWRLRCPKQSLGFRKMGKFACCLLMWSCDRSSALCHHIIISTYHHESIYFYQVAKAKGWNLDDPATWLKMRQSDFDDIGVRTSHLLSASSSPICFYHLIPSVVKPRHPLMRAFLLPRNTRTLQVHFGQHFTYWRETMMRALYPHVAIQIGDVRAFFTWNGESFHHQSSLAWADV